MNTSPVHVVCARVTWHTLIVCFTSIEQMGQTQQFTYQVCTRQPCTNKSASYIYTVENIKKDTHPLARISRGAWGSLKSSRTRKTLRKKNPKLIIFHVLMSCECQQEICLETNRKYVYSLSFFDNKPTAGPEGPGGPSISIPFEKERERKKINKSAHQHEDGCKSAIITIEKNKPSDTLKL